MKIDTPKGTNDYLPNEASLRDFLQGEILKVYTKQGFSRIYTPILEDIENLQNSDGGENLKLIFKVLKRGEKLTSALQNGLENDLSDLGLRYDLTLPLSRFYAKHKNELPSIFKVIQIDRVYRAERPQKGRLREFTQCDIDILGDSSTNAEIELIHTTSKALFAVGIKNFTIRINDRRLLKDILRKAGFKEENFESVCVSFDKLDKIGIDGVFEELSEKGFNTLAIQNFKNIVLNMPKTVKEVENIVGSTPETENLTRVINEISILSKGEYNIRFDLSLVRGQGYYTGQIFEIESEEFSSSLGGGGRYDKLVEKFTGEVVPAVGFSIGFERIFALLQQKNFSLQEKKLAIIYNENDVSKAINFAEEMQQNFITEIFVKPKKLGKFLNKLSLQNFTHYVELGGEIKELKGE